MKKKEMPLHIKFVLLIRKMLFLTIGAFIAAVAIEVFLAPNNIIDGGVVGISMIASYKTGLNLGLLVALINLPFLFLAFTKMGKKFVLQTFFAIGMFALGLNIFHEHFITKDLLLATVFGGLILGTGVGIILKNEGSLGVPKFYHLLFQKIGVCQSANL